MHESSAFEGSTHSPRLDQECGRAERGIRIDSEALGLGGWSCHLLRWESLGKSPLRGKSQEFSFGQLMLEKPITYPWRC